MTKCDFFELGMAIQKEPSEKKRYLAKAAYMRLLAKDAQTETLRGSCLKAAQQYEDKAAALEPSREGMGRKGV